MARLSNRAIRVGGPRRAPRASRAVRWQSPWRACLIVLMLAVVGGQVQTTTRASSPAAQPASEVDATPLIRELDVLLGNEPGIYGVVVMTPEGQTLYSRNRNVPFVAASLFKLVVMASVFELEANRHLARDEALPGWGTVGDALHAMIVHSDNGSTQALIERVGGITVVNDTAHRLGLDHTRLDVDAGWLAHVPDRPSRDSTQESIQQGKEFVAANATTEAVDVTTPDDMARFFRLLLEGQLVSADASKAMLALLARQEIRDRLPVLLPPNTVVAHKTGNLPGVIHDAGVIVTPAGPVIVAVLTETVPTEQRAVEVIQRLALVVYETAEPPPRGGGRPGR